MKKLNSFDLGSRPYKSGLVHDIYYSNGEILKIAKNSFQDFNNQNHFETERNSLELLRKCGIKVPNKLESVKLNYGNKIIYGITETFVQGKQFVWNELRENHLRIIETLFKQAHAIPVGRAGILDNKITGSFDSWDDFVNSIYKEFYHNFSSEDGAFLSKLKSVFDKAGKIKLINNSFLFVDLNPGNIIFNLDQTDGVVIDIDHPYGGDPLYDYGSVMWYSPETFLRLLKINPQLKININKIEYYSIIHGANVLIWMKQHNLDFLTDLNKIKKMMETIH